MDDEHETTPDRARRRSPDLVAPSTGGLHEATTAGDSGRPSVGPCAGSGDPRTAQSDPRTAQLDPRTERPIQFGVRTLLAVTLAVSLLFAGLGWLGVSPFGRGLLLVLLLLSLVAGAGLVVALAHAADDR